MANRVIKRFKDKDSGKIYNAGAFYESESAERVDFLVSEGYLEADKTPQSNSEYPKHTGGGYYELSNGEKVRGKDEAAAAEKELAEAGE